MTLPQNVADAVKVVYKHFDMSMDDDASEAWCLLRAHLLIQEAEIDRLRCDADDNRDAFGELLSAFHKSESRLAAANALLREVYDRGEDFAAYARIQSHLQRAGDETV